VLSTLRQVYQILPSGFRRAVLVKRRENIWRRAGIVFVHVPKAAGTSMNVALYGRFMGHVHANDVHRWASPQVRALPSFAVVRNPWDRVLSAYRFAKAGIGSGPGVKAGMANPQQYDTPEFRTFEAFVNEWLVARDLKRLDGVFQPQWQFVCGADKRIIVDHLGRFENLDETVSFIHDRTGVRPVLTRMNVSGFRLDYRWLFTPSVRNLVGDLYREDIDLFGYEF
jgi:chondroitin 4-sulfotransferase 11